MGSVFYRNVAHMPMDFFPEESLESGFIAVECGSISNRREGGTWMLWLMRISPTVWMSIPKLVNNVTHKFYRDGRKKCGISYSEAYTVWFWSGERLFREILPYDSVSSKFLTDIKNKFKKEEMHKAKIRVLFSENFPYLMDISS